MTNVRLYVFMLLLILLLIFFQYHLWFESGGMRDLLYTKKKLTQQLAINDQLKLHNEKLLLQIKLMQNSQDAAESRARNELGMIKKDEIFYQVVRAS